MFITLVEREVKHSRRSGMSQSCFVWDEIGHAKFVGIRLYSAIWRSERRISSRFLEISSISLSLEEERSIFLACPGFEPTHLCETSDQMRPYVAGLVDCATATQGKLEIWKIALSYARGTGQLGDFSACSYLLFWLEILTAKVFYRKHWIKIQNWKLNQIWASSFKIWAKIEIQEPFSVRLTEQTSWL